MGITRFCNKINHSDTQYHLEVRDKWVRLREIMGSVEVITVLYWGESMVGQLGWGEEFSITDEHKISQ